MGRFTDRVNKRGIKQMTRTVQDILNSNIAPGVKSPEQIRQLRQDASILRSAANKRIARLEKAGIKSAAMSRGETLGLFNNGNKFTTKVSDDKLVDTINDMKQFMKWETSTVKGAKKVALQPVRRLGARMDKKLTIDYTRNYWKTYNKLKENNNLVAIIEEEQFGSERIEKVYYETVKEYEELFRQNPELIIPYVQEKLEKLDEELQEQTNREMEALNEWLAEEEQELPFE